MGAGEKPAAWRSTIACVAFVVAMTLVGWLNDSWTVSVYALSLWHYYIYGLAYLFRAVPLPVFKRDAVLMKGVALAAIAPFYLAAGPGILSLLVVGAGLFLNVAAARALGADRTYYGHELAGVPATWVTGFPYNLIPHPMLIGNALAFAGTLLTPGFAADWWPLILLHVALNLATVVKEVRARPIRLARPPAGHWQLLLCDWRTGAALLALGTLAAILAPAGVVPGVALAALAFGAVLFGAYAWQPVPGDRPGPQTEQHA